MAIRVSKAHAHQKILITGTNQNQCHHASSRCILAALLVAEQAGSMPTARKNLKDSVAATRYHTDKILSFYNTPRIAAGYGEQHYITPCERLLFDKYIRPGMAILDVGVGGGRTSEYLAARASRYVGIDYAPEMIQICRDKCPHLEYFLDSATDLSRFSDRSFDAVVMSYNMLDDLVPSEARQRCLAEC